MPGDLPSISRRILCRACQRVIQGYTDVDTGPCRCDLPVMSREDLEWLIYRVHGFEEMERAIHNARRPPKPWDVR